jgi:hypothetical protein
MTVYNQSVHRSEIQLFSAQVDERETNPYLVEPGTNMEIDNHMISFSGAFLWYIQAFRQEDMRPPDNLFNLILCTKQILTSCWSGTGSQDTCHDGFDQS